MAKSNNKEYLKINLIIIRIKNSWDNETRTHNTTVKVLCVNQLHHIPILEKDLYCLNNYSINSSFDSLFLIFLLFKELHLLQLFYFFIYVLQVGIKPTT